MIFVNLTSTITLTVTVSVTVRVCRSGYPWDQRGFVDVDLCQKDLKSVQKWLSYCYFHTERLCDFIENHMEPKGILGCSFVPKRFKIGLKMAELLLFSH